MGGATEEDRSGGAEGRDAGLVRAMGAWALAASVVNIVVGAGIFSVPGALAACVGARAPLVFLGCAIAIGSVAICFAEGGSRVPTSGGPYGTIEAAFGPLVGYVAGSMLWISDVLACGGIAAALGDLAAAIAPAAWRPATHVATILVVLGAIAAANVAGVGVGARLVNVATAVKLVPLIVFVLVGATAMRAGSFAIAAPTSAGGLGRAVILSLFAFSGMETSLCASGEVASPSRTIPRALAIALPSVTILYVAIQLVAQGVLGASLAGDATPLADAMARVSPALRAMIVAGASLSMLGWIGSDVLGTPRMLFAFARDGWLPRVLGRVHPRTRAPHVAILAYTAIAAVLALTGSFAELAVLSTLALAPLYAAGCVAAWVLARRGVARAGEPLRFRFLSVAVAIGMGSMVVMVALASPVELLGLAGFLGLCGATGAASIGRIRRARTAESAARGATLAASRRMFGSHNDSRGLGGGDGASH